jgi:hypothetical protein
MPNFRSTLPKFTWGAAFVNTLSVGYLLDNVKAGDEPRAGSAFDQTPSGVEDAWITGFDYTLEAELRWIPQTDTASPLATGWDGATGVRAFLQWARQKNQLRFFPDATSGTFITCYLADPAQGYGDVEADGTRRLPFRLRNGSTAFDGY